MTVKLVQQVQHEGEGVFLRALNCILERHPEFISGSRLLELTSLEMLKQVQHDGKASATNSA